MESSSCYPETNQFDQGTAQKLVKEGATLIIIDMPLGSEFGIDMNIFTVGHKFKGVKMIPQGLHFIYYSAVSKEKIAAPRTGFFKFFKSGEVIVKRWNNINEDVDQVDDQDEIERLKGGLTDGSLDQFLGAYQFDNYNCWLGLTDFINERIFEKLNPKCGKIKAVTEYIPRPFVSNAMETTDECSKDSDGLPNLKVEPDSIINFSPIPKRSLYPEGSTPSEISKHSIDGTYTLDHLLSKYQDEKDILAELQFSFVTFLVGQVYDAFEHWKSILKLLCTSSDAMTKYKNLYSDFIRVLHFQLKEVPSDLFIDIIDNTNFLLYNLRRFFSNLESSETIDKSLKARGIRFKENLTKKFKWDFNEDQDDEAPVVVELG